MKKKHKIIIIGVILLILIAIGALASTLKISVAYTDSNGGVTNKEDLGAFTLTFTGSAR